MRTKGRCFSLHGATESLRRSGSLTLKPRIICLYGSGPEAGIRISSLCSQIVDSWVHDIHRPCLVAWSWCGCGCGTETGTDNGVLVLHRFNHALSRLGRQCVTRTASMWTTAAKGKDWPTVLRLAAAFQMSYRLGLQGVTMSCTPVDLNGFLEEGPVCYGRS